jgi:hypothetical protein
LYREYPGISLINSSGNNSNTVNMTGNITTSGTGAYGIFLFNNTATSSNTVNMTGNITTSGIVNNGIVLSNITGSGNTNTVNMTGDITVSAYGIYLLMIVVATATLST